MILLIDIGNSRTKYVEFIEGKISTTVQLNNQDFIATYFTKNFSNASQVVVANVATSSLTNELSKWCQEQAINFNQVYSEQQKKALTSAYQEPTTLGIDRWLTLLGASYLFPKEHVLIIDAGTATTIDLLASNGQHRGGWILVGIKALFNSILSHSTLVHAESKSTPSLVFGTNTTDNVNNACWAATLGMIQQGITQAQQLGNIDRIVFTGGNGKALTTLLLTQTNEHIIDVQSIQFIDNLIFYGLQEYA
jgi:type III pantothenate kinase